MSDRRVVFVSAFPRSGSTWLSWMLGYALDCPVEGWAPHVVDDFVREGEGRPGPYVVRRGHFFLVEEGATVTPGGHKMNPTYLTDEVVVYLVRDPRDVILSWGQYFARPLDAQVSSFTSKEPDDSWMVQTQSWLWAAFPKTCVRYEDIVEDAAGELRRILAANDLPLDRVEAAIEYGELRNLQRRIGGEVERGRWMPKRFFWKATPGHWRENLPPHIKVQLDVLTPLLFELGYEDDEEWWRR